MKDNIPLVLLLGAFVILAGYVIQNFINVDAVSENIQLSLLLRPDAPNIVSLVADDPNNVLEYGNGDTLTLTFDKATSRPDVATKSDLDALFFETPTLGANYVGSWLSLSVLQIKIVDDTGATTPEIGVFTLSLKASGNLLDDSKLSEPSTATSPSLIGDFGKKAGPRITSYVAEDPSNNVGFGIGDRLIVRFSEDTNTPKVADTNALNALFDFSPALSNGYTGFFTNERNLVITITDASGTPPVIGQHTLTVKSSGNLQAIDGSLLSTATSPPLAGTFGRAPGPGFVSLFAEDPDGSDAIVSAGDTITAIFDTRTNQRFGPTLGKTDLEALFSFSQILTTSPVGITGAWIDDVTLVITLVNPTGNTLSTGDQGLRLTVNQDADLKDFTGNSLASGASSSFLSGNFGIKPGPAFLTVQAGDPDGTILGEAVGLTNGDTITATFDQGTNRPNIATKADVDALFAFEDFLSIPKIIGSNYVGTWLTTSVAQITILDASGATVSDPPDLILRVKASGNLKDEPGTSFASTSVSQQITDNFGLLAPPAITDLIAADPSNDDAIFDDGDTITVRFDKDTTLIPLSTLDKAALADLFIFSQAIGDNPSGFVQNARTLLITVDQTEFLPAPPVVGELQLTVIASGDLRALAGSLPSTAVSPVLSGTFGNAPGPGIASIVATDPDGGDAIYSNGDTITVTFDTATNQPDVATKSDLDALFEFSPVLTTAPAGITGTWLDDVTLVITIENANVVAPLIDDDGVDDGELRITARGTGTTANTQILNKALTSLPSKAVSPLLTGNFGTKEGPQIINLVAGDPKPTPVPGFDNSDTITITFDEGTNRPRAITKADLDALFDFKGISLGTDYVGSWFSSNILVITAIDPALATPPVVDAFTLVVKQSANLRNEAGTSLASQSSSPVLSGNFGLEAGPEIESITAADPANDDAIFDEGDTITVRFDKDTDLALTPLNKAQLDSFFIFSQAIGDSYSASIPNTRTVIISIDDAQFLPEPPVIGELQITVRDGQIKAANPLSLFSTSVSPPLEGTFGTAPGPEIIDLIAQDPFGSDAVFGADDTITVSFDVPTNGPDLFGGPDTLTQANLDTLLTFSSSLGSDYTGKWFDSQTLIITVGTPPAPPVPAIGGFSLSVNEATGLQRDTTSLASISASPLLSGDFGTKPGPSIVFGIANDPKVPPVVGVDAGDTITISFDEATNRPPVATKAELDGLFAEASAFGADYSGEWFDPLILIITINDASGATVATGSFTLTLIDDGTDDLNNSANTSLDSTSFLSVLEGNFGQRAGPTILALIADDPKPTPVPGFDNGDTITVIWSEKTNLVNLFNRAELDSFFIFSQRIGDDYTGVLTETGDLVITIVDGEQLTEPPVVGELQFIVKGPANIQAQGGSLPSTAVSPLLAGNFGAFIEEVSLCDEGEAFTTFPDSKTVEISYAGEVGGCGSFVFEVTDETAAGRIEFVGEPLRITPTGDADCSVSPHCNISFVFSEDQIPVDDKGTPDPSDDEPVDPFTDIKILKDVDNDQVIEGQDDPDASNEVFNGLPLGGLVINGVVFDTPDTTVVQLDAVRFEASALSPSNSKFAVGGVKALVLAALVPSISAPSAPSAPSAAVGTGGAGTGSGARPGEFGGIIGDGLQVILYEVAWDKCEERIMRIVAGPPGPGMSVKVFSRLVGLLEVNLAQDQPFTKASVFEVVLDPDETFVRVQIEGVIGREASLAQRSIDLRECEGSIGFYSEPEEPIEPTIVEVPPVPGFPASAPLFPGGSMFETNYNDIDFGVSYKMTKGTISGMKVDEESKSITFSFIDNEIGELILSLPRGLISATEDDFVVMGAKSSQQIEYEIIESGRNHVTLKMALPEGLQELTIVGTSVVPEFGEIAIIVLVILIFMIIIMTRWHRFNFTRFDEKVVA